MAHTPAGDNKDGERMEEIRVKHVKFGNGIITDLTETRVTVQFDSGERKIFPYPGAFSNFLSYEDAGAQERIDAVNETIRQEQEEAEKKRTAEFEEMDRVRRRERIALAKKKREAKAAAEAKAQAETRSLKEKLAAAE